MISVVIPTYKNKGSIAQCINSALSQTYRGPLEIIVVDDNDPESEARKSTEAQMESFASNEIVRYIRHEKNKNGAAARNTGIKASRGEYIAFLDDDDLFLPEKLEKQLAYLEEHPEFDATYCLAQNYDKTLFPATLYTGDVSKHLLMLESHMFTPSLMFRRDSLLAINGFDESFRRHQDYELLLRFFDAGYKMGCVPEVLIELGNSEGQNAPNGKKMEELKAFFFSKFTRFIDKYDKEEPGYAKKVYATHYALVFVKYLKDKKIFNAIRIFNKYFFKSPKQFLTVVKGRLSAHF